jgi:hypothetical protein
MPKRTKRDVSRWHEVNRPGDKYFKGRVIGGERVFHYIVWDGVRDYENQPPLRNLAVVEKTGKLIYVRVDETAVEDIEDINALIRSPMQFCPDVGGLVVWTRDHRTYRLIVQYVSKHHRWLS